MGTEGMLIARARRIDLRTVDQLLALALSAGALADASSQLHHGLGAVAVVSCVLLGGSVAWRRRDPVLSTLVAVTGFAAFVADSGYSGDGAFEVAAIALNFYTLGRHARGRERLLVSGGVFAYWLAGVAVITYSTPGGSVSQLFGAWAVVGGLPFAVGRTLETRRALIGELEANTARLGDEQELRARRAAGEERSRMARELHDVIAHCVSVMVVQTGAASRVARTDLEAARTALGVVERSGRDALVELRRIVGVVRHGTDELTGAPAPGLSQLNALVDRARGAGVDVELRVEDPGQALPRDVDLVAYRVLQEALTNAIKHAGPTRARVNLSFGPRDLRLQVLDTGCGSAAERAHEARSGHGLIGMGERVALYGGELHAGPRADRVGFEVRARIPLDGIASTNPPSPAPTDGATLTGEAGGLRWPWLDPSLAVVVLVALEVGTLVGSHRRGPLVLDMLAAAGVALATVWRRRSPLLFVIVVGTLVAVSSWRLESLSNAPLTGAYVALVPSYTVAAWEHRRNAVLGLAFVLCGALILNLGAAGDIAGAGFAVTAAWAAGRAIRSRRALTWELKRTLARLVAEREDRARLAVAGERTRIARELHAAVAQSVEAMVIQAEAARTLLGARPAQANAAMSAIEHTGRQALEEMRRILGVLRHAGEPRELAPQPGVEQIYTLIHGARERGQPVDLSVDGEPGTLTAAVDLAIYRILEEALSSVRELPARPVSVGLRFGEQDLELHLASARNGPNRWPTDAMRERIALCGGELDADTCHEAGWRFVARMPRGLQGALA